MASAGGTSVIRAAAALKQVTLPVSSATTSPSGRSSGSSPRAVRPSVRPSPPGPSQAPRATGGQAPAVLPPEVLTSIAAPPLGPPEWQPY